MQVLGATEQHTLKMFKMLSFGTVCWLTFIIPLLGRWSQENMGFKVNLAYVISYLKQQNFKVRYIRMGDQF